MNNEKMVPKQMNTILSLHRKQVQITSDMQIRWCNQQTGTYKW
jgi:hypothetical protein